MPTVREVISDEFAKWVAANSEEELRSWVRRKLDKEARTILFTMMGLSEDSWGRMSVLSQSTVQRLVKGVAEVEVQKWLDKNLTSLPQMTDKLKGGVLKEYKYEYERQLKHKLREIAAERVDSAAETLVANYAKSFDTMELDKAVEEKDEEDVMWNG